MGRQTGFEPATLGTTSRCSNQLSYYRHIMVLYLKKYSNPSMRKHKIIFRAFLTIPPSVAILSGFLLLCYKLELLAYLM